MENPPIEIQEDFYQRFYKLKFEDCLKHIKKAHDIYYQKLSSKFEKSKYDMSFYTNPNYLTMKEVDALWNILKSYELKQYVRENVHYLNYVRT